MLLVVAVLEGWGEREQPLPGAGPCTGCLAFGRPFRFLRQDATDVVQNLLPPGERLAVDRPFDYRDYPPSVSGWALLADAALVAGVLALVAVAVLAAVRAARTRWSLRAAGGVPPAP